MIKLFASIFIAEASHAEDGLLAHSAFCEGCLPAAVAAHLPLHGKWWREARPALHVRIPRPEPLLLIIRIRRSKGCNVCCGTYSERQQFARLRDTQNTGDADMI